MANEDNEVCGAQLTEAISEIGIGEWLYKIFSEPPHDALVLSEADSGRIATRRDMLQLCTAFATGLRQMAVEPGDVIAVVGDNSIDLCVVAFGSAMMGAVICPIDPSLKSYEYQHLLNLIEPKVIVSDSFVIETLKDAMAKTNCHAQLIAVQESEDLTGVKFLKDVLIEIAPEEFQPNISKDMVEETLCLVCSSGTTGLPKAVMQTHYSFAYQIASSGAKAWKTCPTLQTSFFYWISGILMMYGFACGGGHRVLLRSTDPLQILKAIQDCKIIMCVFSPTLLSTILSHPQVYDFDLSSLRAVNSGGSLLLKSTVDKLKEVVPACVVIQVYGLSEMAGAVCRAMPPMDVLKIGKPVPDAKIKIVDMVTGEALGPEEEGELWIWCPSVMKGYYKNEEATRAVIDDDGWFHSGDLGKYSEDGILRLTGRAKDLLKVDNHQVCPAEIEDLIGTVAGVQEVVVVGIPAEENHLPMALVVKDSDSIVSEDDIQRVVSENLSEFKQLRGGVVFVDQIDRTSNGKLRRRDIQPIAEALYAKMHS